MATSVKLDDDLKSRIQHLAETRHRSAHWIMREAIRDYVEREEARESFKQEALASWTAYQETGHLGGEYTLFGGVMPVTFCFLAGAIAMFVVSLITPKPSEATIRKFFPESL